MFRAIVTTTIVSRYDTQKRVHYLMEVADAETLDDVRRQLIDKGLIYGERVIYEVLPDGRRKVISRNDQVITRDGIITVSPCPYEYYEADEVGSDE